MNPEEINHYSDKSIVDLFFEAFLKYPNNIALNLEGQTLTYQQLEDKSNQLANLLIDEGVNQHDQVPIILNRSLEMIIGILGIMKCGASYVPIAPEFPNERKKIIIESTASSILIANETDNSLEGSGVRVLGINDIKKRLLSYPILGTTRQISPEHIAYTIFTSGSTGKPKGVCVPHRALVNLLIWQQKNSMANSKANTLQFTKLTFDVSFQEIFSTLTTGGTLFLTTEELVKNPLGLLKFIERNKINRLFQPFVSFQALCNAAVLNNLYPQSIKEIITAGEQLKITPNIRKFYSQIESADLYNQYGPTETAVIVTNLKLSGNDVNKWPNLPSIGFPIDNVQAFILDDKECVLNEGLEKEGELVIAGPCLASGYLNQHELTSQKFKTISHPEKGDIKVYKTGDIAKIETDRTITFLGRRDHQVKIRGYRIELGEIEAVLNEYALINQVVVVARENEDGYKFLVAYYTTDQSDNISQKSIIQHLATTLPEYMIPSIFVKLSDFTKTTSGKIDRNNLPLPISRREEFDSIIVNPKSEIEKSLSRIFKNILNFDIIGTEDNFFEFGGNSLLAQKLSIEIKEELGLVITVPNIYQSPTIKALTKHLEPEQKNTFPKNTSKKLQASTQSDVAIVGLSGRFPGADDVAGFWKNLLEGKSSISRFSKDELDSTIPDYLKNDPNYVPARGIIQDVEKFDPLFFGIPPSQAALMDPQQRIFLEIAWELLENEHFSSNEQKSKIGVFAGTNNNTYYQNNILPNRKLVERFGSIPVMTLNEKDYVSSRTAYHLNLSGPAISVYSACSTSLLAVAQAVQSIRSGQCEMAIAGGSSVSSPVKTGHLYQEGAIFSKDGHCKPFDKTSSGTLFNDGAGAVLLKNLDKAIEDGNTILAVIKGIGVNNDGGNKGSFSAPSAEGQAGAIHAALKDAQTSPESISYVEMHGTGTPVGDPIEAEGLKMAFGFTNNRQHKCTLGSVKSNIGHLTAAAGVAGLIKTVLALRNKKIPATVGFNELNSNIDFVNTPFFINNSTTDWIEDFPRKAGVSSFGIGGTNVHIVVEEYPEKAHTVKSSTKPYKVINIAAKSENSLHLYWKKLRQFIESAPHINLDDLSYSINRKKSEFSYKSYLTFSDRENLIKELEKTESSPAPTNRVTTEVPNPIFLFPGQGAQYLNMGKDLYQIAPIFREALDHCISLFNTHIDFSLREIIFPNESDSIAESILKNTKYTQPAIFAIEYALAKQWQSWGVVPSYLCGHSIGEFVAAHLSGIFCLEDAIRLVAIRGKLVADLPHGDMLSVRASVNKINTLISEDLSIAAINSPELCVVAGPSYQIEKFSLILEKHEILHKKLFTSHAFHSSMMDPILDAFHEEVSKVKMKQPKIPIISTVTGKHLTEEEATSTKYWTDHLRKSVLFSPTIEHITSLNATTIFLEIGPGNGLSTLIKQHKSASKSQTVNSLNRLDEKNEYHYILTQFGRLISLGIKPKWDKFYHGENNNFIETPTYAFDKQRCWIDPIQTDRILETKTEETVIFPSPLQAEAELTPRKRIRDKLIKILLDISGINYENTPDHQTFMEMGLDSLLLTQLSFTFQKEFKTPLSFKLLTTSFNSLDKLVNHLLKFSQETSDLKNSVNDNNLKIESDEVSNRINQIQSNLSNVDKEALLLISKQMTQLSQQINLLLNVNINTTGERKNEPKSTQTNTISREHLPNEGEKIEVLKSNSFFTNYDKPPVPGALLGKTLDGKPAWFINDPNRAGKYLLLESLTFNS